MADISIEEAKAKIWMDDVKNELVAVEAILKKVNSSLMTTAETDDSIMKGIYKVGTAMETAWSKMCGNFKNAQKNLSDAISKIVISVDSVVQDAEALKNTIQ